MAHEKVTFKGALGEPLAARLELPDKQAPKAFVLFAHCFACSKDLPTISRICRSMTDHGFAIMRFDFTGLGHSEGEFANTNFSSNVEDIQAAANFLRQKYKAPKILIGHSLGGTAILSASQKIPEANAVATIGSPFDPAHIQHLFPPETMDAIEKNGEGTFEFFNKTLKIKKHFIDDINGHNMTETLQNLRKALLVFHSPRDQTVEIENAALIYQAAKHPKSFISLDNADHMLTHPEDAAYVATVLTAWASRYL